MGVLDRWITTKLNWEKFQQIEILGIDEIALKRGHRDYVVLVTTPLFHTFLTAISDVFYLWSYWMSVVYITIMSKVTCLVKLTVTRSK